MTTADKPCQPGDLEYGDIVRCIESRGTDGCHDPGKEYTVTAVESIGVCTGDGWWHPVGTFTLVRKAGAKAASPSPATRAAIRDAIDDGLIDGQGDRDGLLKATDNVCRLLGVPDRPEEPAPGSVVIDRNGRAWQRTTYMPHEWQIDALRHPWAVVVDEFGPVRVIWTPDATAEG